MVLCPIHYFLCNLWYLIDDLEHLQQLTADGWLLLQILLKPTHAPSSICVLSHQFILPLFQCPYFCCDKKKQKRFFISSYTLFVIPSHCIPRVSVATLPHAYTPASKHFDGEQMLIRQLFKYKTKIKVGITCEGASSCYLHLLV